MRLKVGQKSSNFTLKSSYSSFPPDWAERLENPKFSQKHYSIARKKLRGFANKIRFICNSMSSQRGLAFAGKGIVQVKK